MPREKRQLSDSGIYYIFAKGIFERGLTRSNFDKMKLVACIADAKKELPFILYAYCVCNNELHLLLKEHNEMDISKIMQSVLYNYTTYYNIKYDETGSLIYDRFKSRPVYPDEVNSFVRFIHQTPMRIREHPNVFSYDYSSYKHYFAENDALVNTSDVIASFRGDNTREKLSRFKIFHTEFEQNDYLMTTRNNVPDELVDKYIEDVCGMSPSEIKMLSISEERRYIIKLKAKRELTLSQMEDALGIPRAILSKF